MPADEVLVELMLFFRSLLSLSGVIVVCVLVACMRLLAPCRLPLGADCFGGNRHPHHSLRTAKDVVCRHYQYLSTLQPSYLRLEGYTLLQSLYVRRRPL